MNTVTQTMQFRQSLLKYAEKYGVTKAAIKYNVNRQYIYRWKRRYNGDIQSLANKSHRPHHHPNQHTEAELQKIKNFRRRNPNTGLVVLWVKLRRSGYTRSITGLYRVLRRQGQMNVKLPDPKYIPKPYEKMRFPGERVQIDVKFVPEACIVGDAAGEKFYQYTAIDEFSRWRYLEALRVARDTWTTEIEKWDHLKGLDISVIVGDVKTRIAAVHHPAMIYVVNRENIKWLVEYYEKNGMRWDFSMVVIDELSWPALTKQSAPTT